ncbi:Replicative DNA helicase [Syntrophus gentianae]|uniref:Replicative DNA helicase n=1 Tax=Syntrophus gentianae TaxID=43775 RepID=A0A1H7XUM0_9BACT|nr:DnaB-like helicase C-terminal domain-containing protein [Syntrophus gentianae]SEM36838.1 Replicative DNA helicase [Syntrophus gentianae]
MTEQKKDFEEKMGAAHEAEVDPDRRQMEEAILATIAKVGPDDPFSITFDKTYGEEMLAFSRPDLEAIARALWSLVCLNLTAADPALMRGKLQASGEGEKVHDAVLAGILDGSKAVDTSIARGYIEKLHILSKYDAAKATGHEYLNAIEKAKKEGKGVEGVVADLSKKVFNLAKEKKLLREYDPEVIAAYGFLDTLKERRTEGRDWLGLDCGFRYMNEVLNGLPEGVIILAGAPSCGKTTLAKQIADHVAQVEKVPVLFYSFEQSAEELRIKSLARLSHVDSRVIGKGRTNDETWKEVEKAAAHYIQGPGEYLTIVEADRNDTIEAIWAAALMAKRKAGGKPILLILDYLQIIPAGKDAPDAIREKINWNLSELRRLSRDLKSPVLVISSQNRETYKGNKQPTLASLKESGGMEYSADVVICLWRKKGKSESMETDRVRHDVTCPKTIRVEAYVLKNRNGHLTKVKLDFTPAWADFGEDGKGDLSYNEALG